jgi:ABC-type sugar transport system ATPase subunit
MKLAQRLVILRDGRIEQAGPPAEIYRRPRNVFVGKFLGLPPMNVLDAGLLGAGRSGTIGIRPHHLELTPPGEGNLDATVQLVEITGSEQHVHLRVASSPDARLVAVVPADRDVPVETRVGVRMHPNRIHLFER